ncbi:gfo/Idh/MocA family oxidoreductase [archaeon]|nr:gfo/Idh/MocA family oxidoreductase [archaeon]
MVKIIQIGTGGWGKNHCRVLSELGVLSGICDLNTELADKLAKQYGVPSIHSIEDLIENHDFDGVVIATPTKTHFTIASELIKHKKHVFVEKPMTYQSIEGEKLVKLAKEHNVLLTSGYIERFNPVVSEVKNIAKEKIYGDLLMLEFHRERALWLFDDTPKTVYAKSGKIRHHHEDFSSIMLGFSNNRVANIVSNWITPVRIRTFNAIFSEGRIGADFITRQMTIDTIEGTTKPLPKQGEPLSLELKNFIDTISGKASLLVSPINALNVTRIAEAAIEARSNRPDTIDSSSSGDDVRIRSSI